MLPANKAIISEALPVSSCCLQRSASRLGFSADLDRLLIGASTFNKICEIMVLRKLWWLTWKSWGIRRVTAGSSTVPAASLLAVCLHLLLLQPWKHGHSHPTTLLSAGALQGPASITSSVGGEAAWGWRGWRALSRIHLLVVVWTSRMKSLWGQLYVAMYWRFRG